MSYKVLQNKKKIKTKQLNINNLLIVLMNILKTMKFNKKRVKKIKILL